jgi:ankyrin repeat protein
VAWTVQSEPESTISSLTLESAVSATNDSGVHNWPGNSMKVFADDPSDPLNNENHSEYHAKIRQISPFLPFGLDGNDQVSTLRTNKSYVDFLTAAYALSNNIEEMGDRHGERLLEICRSKHGVESLRELLASRNHTIMAAAEKLLTFAVSANDERLTKTLLNADINPDAKFAYPSQYEDLSNLEIAVANRYKNIVSLLIEAGARVDPIELLFFAFDGYFDIEFVKLFLAGPVADDKTLQWNKFLAKLHYTDHQQKWSIELVDLLLSYFGKSTGTCYEMVEALLPVAVESGMQELVRYLLSLEAVPKLSSPGKDASLESAVCMDDVSMVELLVAHGAQPNRTQHSHIPLPTALQSAAQNGNLYLVHTLLNNGAHVNAAPFNESVPIEIPNKNLNMRTTTLQFGVKGGNLEVVKMLIKAGAALTESCLGDMLQTALEIACAGGSDDIIHLLLSHGAKVNAETKSLLIWHTPLTRALRRKCKHITELLLERGADINVPSKDSKFPSPLQVCVEGGEIDMVKRFLDLGAHPYDSGALWAAAYSDYPQIIRLLLQHNDKFRGISGEGLGAKPNDYGRAALSTAIGKRYHESARLLLDAGVDVTLPPQTTFLGGLYESSVVICSTQCAALAAAISVMDINLVRTLLDTGADVNVCPGENYVHADCVFDYLDLTLPNLEEMVELLSANGARINRCKSRHPPLHRAAYQNLSAVVRLFLLKGAEIDLQPGGDFSRTALQEAAAEDLVDMVGILIECGADTNAGPAEFGGATAIQFAAINGNFKILQLLLAANADLFARRGYFDGRTALEGAAENGRLDMVQFILEKSTEVEELYFEHQLCRAIQYARKSGHIVLAEMIRSHQVERYGSSECRGHESVFVLDSNLLGSWEEKSQAQAAFPRRCFDSTVYEEAIDPAVWGLCLDNSDTPTKMSDDSDDFESTNQDSKSIASPSALANNPEPAILDQDIFDVVSPAEMEGVDFHNALHPGEPNSEQGYQHGYDEMLMIPPFDIDQIVPETTISGFIVEEPL